MRLPSLLIIILTTALAQGSSTSCPASITPAESHSLNATLNGALVHVHPPAFPCHQATFDQAQCTTAKQNWTVSSWRSSQIGATFSTTWEQRNGNWCIIGAFNSTTPLNETCKQGNVPSFGVVARTPADISKAVTFASQHRLRLSVKGTGHDLLGRSQNGHQLLIWTHLMKNITTGTKNICGVTEESVTVAAGGQWGEVYGALAAINRTVPGGSDSDVGASGGQVMGGGHSQLSNTYGLTTDNIIEFTVVTMDGKLRTVNSCQNTDLFWALRGGGGGTYAIVTSTTFKTVPDGLTAVVLVSSTITGNGYVNALTQFTLASPSLADAGWSGDMNSVAGTFNGILILPLIGNKTIASATAQVQPFLTALSKQEGVNVTTGILLPFPSFAAVQSQLLASTPGGSAGSVGSRLIPRASLTDEKERTQMVALIANNTDGAGINLSFVAGGAVSKPTNSAILPAWRKAIWHAIISSGVAEGASKQEIDASFKGITARVQEFRTLTPGGGAYMNEADARAPNWKEDFFGVNYDRLLSIKLKYDPLLLLHCNRCVGSDLQS